ncbi:MAG: helix-turn-helix domain-containing protein [Lachnospiraceae bacterium]|nr:helix-turn-helix domain-containing protein [Lachnospiraceae bacterium]
MKQEMTIQERLKDLRLERHLKLEELATATGISKSALGSYENEEYKEISHGSLVTLAKFYGVSTDYLLCLTENRNHSNTELTELHLNDDMIELLKSGHINNRLLCEIATHKDFVTLMTDTEIYVDGIATMHFKDFNSLLEVLREQILSKYQPAEEDTALKALDALQIQEEDYFCQITHRTWDAILHDIRTVHKDDTDSAPDDSNALKLLKDAQKAMAVPGSYLDVFTALMCTQLQIRYEKLTEQERTILKNIMKKSPAYKDSPLSRMKRR